MVVVFIAGTVMSVLCGLMDIVLLSDIHQSLIVNRTNGSSNLNGFYDPLFYIDYEPFDVEGIKGYIDNHLILAYLIILLVPEVHRWLTCFYFVLFRQYRQWDIKNIIAVTVIEVIDAIFLGLFVYDCAKYFPSLQLISFGFMTATPMCVLQLLGVNKSSWVGRNKEVFNLETNTHSKKPTAFFTSNECDMVLKIGAVLFQIGALSVLLWTCFTRVLPGSIIVLTFSYILTSSLKHWINHVEQARVEAACVHHILYISYYYIFLISTQITDRSTGNLQDPAGTYFL